jgi:exopolyphosphatase/guanosine-5'-triphosphate,3'-diphosphate pyrophosphatase
LIEESAANNSDSNANHEVMAAVDLGSNSFHMIVGELRYGQLTILDRLRETVRLAEGLSVDGDLSDDARHRALDCLSRFGERLRAMHADNVRAAGTSTIRRAREDSTFMVEAEEALGHPIEVISGLEEARLIFSGATKSMPPNDGLRLVLDIGGGSTELILGRGNRPIALESLHLGCVSMTERFFPDGRITPAAFLRARVAARLALRPIKAFFRGAGGVEAIGTSGTIISTQKVVHELKLADAGHLTSAAVEKLIGRVLEFELISELSLPGLSERRSQVWPGGLAILAELLSVLHLDTLQISNGALREGLLYDLLGRGQEEDARERTVQAMRGRYNVDVAQSARVSATANSMLRQCAKQWNLNSPLLTKILTWSAELHEIGLDISHSGFHRHGAYVAEHADMPGFPQAEQRFLAFLIGSQRNQVSTRARQKLPRAWRKSAMRLVLLLRLAVLLNRNRSDFDLPTFKMEVGDSSLALSFDPVWLEENPLTVADLEQERALLENTGYTLEIR